MPSSRNLSNSRNSHGQSESQSTASSYALVKWLDGQYEGSFTHDVLVSWILNFNSTSPYPETYAIEWRHPPRPRTGWPVLNAEVLEVSSDLQFLKTKMQVFKTQQQGEEDNLNRSSNPSPNPSLMDVNSNAFRELLRRLQPSSSESSGSGRSSPREQEETVVTEEMVSIGKSLKVEKRIYLLARSASSPGRMVRPLLRQAFSRHRLETSTYAGQKRTINGKTIVKKGLKKYQKMADIQGAVLERFPYVSQAQFGAIVNSHLGEKANEIHEMKYVDVSDSDSEF